MRMNEIQQDKKELSQRGWTNKTAGEKYSKEMVYMLHQEDITWSARF